MSIICQKLLIAEIMAVWGYDSQHPTAGNVTDALERNKQGDILRRISQGRKHSWEGSSHHSAHPAPASEDISSVQGYDPFTAEPLSNTPSQRSHRRWLSLPGQHAASIPNQIELCEIRVEPFTSAPAPSTQSKTHSISSSQPQHTRQPSEGHQTSALPIQSESPNLGVGSASKPKKKPDFVLRSTPAPGFEQQFESISGGDSNVAVQLPQSPVSIRSRTRTPGEIVESMSDEAKLMALRMAGMDSGSLYC